MRCHKKHLFDATKTQKYNWITGLVSYCQNLIFNNTIFTTTTPTATGGRVEKKTCLKVSRKRNRNDFREKKFPPVCQQFNKDYQTEDTVWDTFSLDLTLVDKSQPDCVPHPYIWLSQGYKYKQETFKWFIKTQTLPSFDANKTHDYTDPESLLIAVRTVWSHRPALFSNMLPEKKKKATAAGAPPLTLATAA